MDLLFNAIFIISILLNIIFFVIIKKCLYRIEFLEDLVLSFKKNIENLYKNLKYIDERDMFEKDDDVGILFSQIYDMIEKFKYTILDDEFINGEEKDKKKEK